MNRLVILGAGTAGTMVANRMRSRLPAASRNRLRIRRVGGVRDLHTRLRRDPAAPGQAFSWRINPAQRSRMGRI
jgi:hypothetical protein